MVLGDPAWAARQTLGQGPGLPKAAMTELELPTDALPILSDGGGRLPHSLPVGDLPFLLRPGFAGCDGDAFEVVNPNVAPRDNAVSWRRVGSNHI